MFKSPWVLAVDYGQELCGFRDCPLAVGLFGVEVDGIACVECELAVSDYYLDRSFDDVVEFLAAVLNELCSLGLGKGNDHGVHLSVLIVESQSAERVARITLDLYAVAASNDI